ncbi:MAG TPA: hypothetical protein VN962_26775 [Polyangia bacterium]|nr:hypothetical protein [Polyangia bacterium]
MNRLRDESALDPISERGISLLRQVEPPPRPPEMKWRVWASLQQAPDGAARAARPGRLKAVVLGASILVSAATAAGAIGGSWIVKRVEQLRAPAPPVPTTIHERPRVVHRVASLAPRPDVDALLESPAQAPLPARAPTVRPSEPSRPHRVAMSTARQRTQVLDALIALRRDHDPARASALLDTYFDSNRHGPLREEALVLAIEAADGRGDAARAVRFAHTYQNEFPHGRFDAFVRSHLQE